MKMTDKNHEFLVVVDVETAGPNPGQYSMLSLGACTLSDPPQTFYVEFMPDKPATDAEAMHIHKLSMQDLAQNGTHPESALLEFEEWVLEVSQGKTPIFTAFNAPFDWMFVNDYFMRYLGRNPFGHAALDIKALFMGVHHSTWRDTTHSRIAPFYGLQASLPHHALQDVLQEVKILKRLLKDMEEGDEQKGKGRTQTDH